MRKTTTTTTGTGNLSAVQIEQAAHMMASFLGQLVDEGHLDALGEQDTMSGMTPKFAALRLLDRFDGIAYGE